MATSPATIWLAGSTTIPLVNGAGNIQEEWQTAAASQTVFNLAGFQYTPDTRSIFVYVNGVLQQRAVDYAETSVSVVTFSSGLNVDDKVCFIAYAIVGVLTS